MKTMSCLTLAAALLAGCGSSNPNDDLPELPHDVRIVQNAASNGPNAFSPANFTISLASQTSVTWLNSDFSGTGPYGGSTGVTHRLASNDGSTFTSGNILSNGTFVASFSAPGSYGYHCSIHPAMTGTITVNP